MIQDVKLGTHRIGTYMYAISKCAFLLGFRLEILFMWVWKGVWPQEGLNGVAYDASYFDIEGFTRQQL